MPFCTLCLQECLLWLYKRARMHRYIDRIWQNLTDVDRIWHKLIELNSIERNFFNHHHFSPKTAHFFNATPHSTDTNFVYCAAVSSHSFLRVWPSKQTHTTQSFSRYALRWNKNTDHRACVCASSLNFFEHLRQRWWWPVRSSQSVRLYNTPSRCLHYTRTHCCCTARVGGGVAGYFDRSRRRRPRVVNEVSLVNELRGASFSSRAACLDELFVIFFCLKGECFLGGFVVKSDGSDRMLRFLWVLCDLRCWMFKESSANGEGTTPNADAIRFKKADGLWNVVQSDVLYRFYLTV